MQIRRRIYIPAKNAQSKLDAIFGIGFISLKLDAAKF